jgi:flagellar protein FlgJ
MNVNEPSFYADNSRLQEIKNTNDVKSLSAVAKEFEALYLQMLLKSMREASKSFNSGLLADNTTAQYEEMYHNQLAMHIAQNNDIGMAAQITKQMQPYVQQNASQQIDANTVAANAIVNPKASAAQIENFGQFATPREFIDKLTPPITEAAKELGVSPQVLLAQAALESGWGQSAQDSRNLFGIKADKAAVKNKAFVAQTTHEYINGKAEKVVENFRAYKDYVASIKDYVNFIKTNPRYKDALALAAHPEQYVKALQNAGYATDPNYAQKVMGIYNRIKVG